MKPVKCPATPLRTTCMEQLSTLSGGQQKRLAMAKVLIHAPDVLILDEPTNHLDVDMIEQLEDELNAPNMTVLLVTHDRYFLDNVCDEIIEMEFGDFTRFKGNYSYYVEKKALLDDVRDATQHHLRGLMKSELEWVRKCLEHVARESKSVWMHSIARQMPPKIRSRPSQIDVEQNDWWKVIEARKSQWDSGTAMILLPYNRS